MANNLNPWLDSFWVNLNVSRRSTGFPVNPNMQDMIMFFQENKVSNEHNYTHLYCEKGFILPQRQQIYLNKLASIVQNNRCSDLNGKQFKSLA